MTRARLLNYATFTILMVSTAFGYQALWGLLFLYWTIPNFYSGHAFLLSDVTREEDPILFWMVQIAWVVLGLLLITLDFFHLWPEEPKSNETHAAFTAC